MVQKALSTIVKEAAAQPNDRAKAEYLRANDSEYLRKVLAMAYDRRMEWALPDGRPPFDTPDQNAIDQEDMLYSQFRKLYIFFKIPNPMFGMEQNHGLTRQRREMLFVQLLEAMPAADAELILQVKERNIEGLPAYVACLAFPGLREFCVEHETPYERRVVATDTPAPAPKKRGRKKKDAA